MLLFVPKTGSPQNPQQMLFIYCPTDARWQVNPQCVDPAPFSRLLSFLQTAACCPISPSLPLRRRQSSHKVNSKLTVAFPGPLKALFPTVYVGVVGFFYSSKLLQKTHFPF